MERTTLKIEYEVGSAIYEFTGKYMAANPLFVELQNEQGERKQIRIANIVTIEELNDEIDFASLESISLTMVCHYWQSKLKDIDLTPTIKEVLKANDCYSQFIPVYNQLKHRIKINEIDPKFGSIQQILHSLNTLAVNYRQEIFYELIALILIEIKCTYAKMFQSSCDWIEIYLSDAIVYQQYDQEAKMTEYLNYYFQNVIVDDNNINQFKFFARYIIKYSNREAINFQRDKSHRLTNDNLSFFNQFMTYIDRMPVNGQMIQKSKKNISINDFKNNLIDELIENQDSQATLQLLENEREYLSHEDYQKIKEIITVIGKVIDMVSKRDIISAQNYLRKRSSMFTSKQNLKLSVLVRNTETSLEKNLENYFLNSQYEEAYLYVEHLFKLEPNNQEISSLLQKMNEMRFRAKKQHYLPNDKSNYSIALRAWHIEENYRKAKDYFLKAIAERKEKTMVKALLNLVDLVLFDEDIEAAIKVLEEYEERVLTLSNENKIKYYEKKYSLYTHLKNYEEMQSALTQLLRLYENNENKRAATYFRIAQCQYNLNHVTKAIATFKQAMECGYSTLECVRQLVKIYLSQGQEDEAVTLIEQYSTEDNNLANLLERVQNEKNDNVLTEDFFGLETPFITHYENSCDFAGIGEEKKNNRLFDENDINGILRLIHTSTSNYDNTTPKSRANYYLTAACIEKVLNDKSQRYYYYLANSLQNQGHMFFLNRQYDNAKSYYLQAIKFNRLVSNFNEDDSHFDTVALERNTVSYYLRSILKSDIQVNRGAILMFENEMNIDLPQIMDKFDDVYVQNDFYKVLNASPLLRDFIKDNECLATISKYLNVPDDIEAIVGKIHKLNDLAINSFNSWKSHIQNNTDYAFDISSLKNSILLTELDNVYIKEFLKYYHQMDSYKTYPDYENKLLHLTTVKNNFIDLENEIHHNSTEFLEDKLVLLCTIAIDKLDQTIEQINEDYCPELEIDVPINKMTRQQSRGAISITIKNKENHSTAHNIYLVIEKNDGMVLYRKSLGNLKGGSKLSELAEIQTFDEDAFTINIVVTFNDGRNKSYQQKETFSIDMHQEAFQKIDNPYIAGTPIVDDKMFFGRQEMIEELENALNQDTIRCIIIYGQKRSGKSSILKHLQKRLDDQFIIIDFSVGMLEPTRTSFYKIVQNKLLRYLMKNRVQLDYRWIMKQELTSITDFSRFLETVKSEICQPLDKELLLMIDEFTTLYKYIQDANKQSQYDRNYIDKYFMQEWKAMIEENLFKAALVGQLEMLDFIREFPNEFQVTEPLYVSYLSHQAALKLVNQPILLNDSSRFKENADEAIVDWFNGQPYYIQTYCNKLVNYLNEHQQNYVTAAIANQVKEILLEEKEIDFFDNLVVQNEEPLWQLLKKIAIQTQQKDGWINIATLECSQYESNNLEKLINRKVVVKDHERCKIIIPFFKDWLVKNY